MKQSQWIYLKWIAAHLVVGLIAAALIVVAIGLVTSLIDMMLDY